MTQRPDGHPTLETLGRGHGDRSYPAFAEMLLHFEGHLGGLAVDGVIDLERIVDLGQCALFGVELGVDDGADDLYDFTCVAHERAIGLFEKKLS